VTNELERPDRTDIRVVNRDPFGHWGSDPGELTSYLEYSRYYLRGERMEFTCFVLLSNFRLHDQDRVTYLVYTQVSGMGISVLF